MRSKVLEGTPYQKSDQKLTKYNTSYNEQEEELNY